MRILGWALLFLFCAGLLSAGLAYPTAKNDHRYRSRARKATPATVIPMSPPANSFPPARRLLAKSTGCEHFNRAALPKVGWT